MGNEPNSRNRNKKREEPGNRPAPHFLIQIQLINRLSQEGDQHTGGYR